LQGLQYIGVPLKADFELDEAAMSAAIAQHEPAIVYIAYPNNPTANLWDADTIRRLITQVSAYGGLVVMDEAYQPFSSKSWLDEIRQHPAANANVLLMRTLSKFGLAGIRLGYMIAPQALINEVDKLRPPYNVSVLNAGCVSMSDWRQDFVVQLLLPVCLVFGYGMRYATSVAHAKLPTDGSLQWLARLLLLFGACPPIIFPTRQRSPSSAAMRRRRR
jgi:histidinol-phosphate aminotransferase